MREARPAIITHAAVFLLAGCAMMVAPTPRPAAGDPLLDEIGGHFHAAHKWFGMVSDLEFERDAAHGYAPRWESLHSSLVIKRDGGGQRLSVKLPELATAAHAIGLEGNDTLGVSVSEPGLLPVHARLVRGVVVYPGALAGGDLLYKLTPTHVDEYVYLRSPPPSLQRRIVVQLGQGVSRLHEVHSGVEVLDQEGTARLRVSAPIARAADGTRRTGTAHVNGTELVLDIDLRGLAAPILLDPDWSTTGTMTVGHWSDQTFLRADGRVLVVGGCALSGCPTTFARPACGQVLADTEIWAEPSGTWSAGPPLATPRYAFAGVPVGSGDFLVAGGCTSTTCSATTATAERYVLSSGTWADAGGLSSARANVMGATLPGGDALVVGGCDPGACYPAADRFVGSSGAWVGAASMASARAYATATALGDGRVLVVGGCSDPACASIRADAEIYDPVADHWSPSGGLSTARAGHSATLLGDGTVLVAGGCSDALCTYTLPTTEVWHTDGTFHAGPTMPGARHNHTATLLATGEVLVAGGANGPASSLPEAEVYVPSQSRWIEMETMNLDRAYHTAVLLPSNNVIVAGGCNPTTCMPWAEVFSPSRIPALLDGGGAETLPDAGPPPNITIAPTSPHPPLYRNGVTKCATDTVQELACPLASHPLQDGDFQPNALSYTAAAGGVTDTSTGLVWQAQDDGNNYDLAAADHFCRSLSLPGAPVGTWRLPSVVELMTLVDYGVNSPSIDPGFTSTIDGGSTTSTQSTNYWTSTPVASGSGQNWTVKFDYGEVVPMTTSRAIPVRCVSGGPTGPPTLRQAGPLITTEGTVRDGATGLEWQRVDDGVRRTWQDALAYCARLPLAGETGWHLPNVNELRGVVEYGALQGGVAIDPAFQGARADLYWTATPNDGSPTLSWSVGFNLGVVDGVTVTGVAFARCVRHITPPTGPTPSSCGCRVALPDAPVGTGLAAILVAALAWLRRARR